MNLLAPALLAALLALAVPLILHLVRPRPRRLRVATLPFFLALRAHESDAPWLRRLKRLLAILCSLLLVGLPAFALARPVLAPGAGAVSGVVVLVDRSASMGAVDADGASRLDHARRLLRQRLAALPAAVPVAVVAHDAAAEILCAPTPDRRAVERALDEVRVRPIAGGPEAADAARRFAARLARPLAPAAIWDASDRPATAATVAGVDLVPVAAALPAPRNAGITAADLRRRPLEPARIDAFVEIGARLPAGTATEAVLRVHRGGALIGIRTVPLSADAEGRCAPVRLSLPVEGGQGDLRLGLTMPGDALAADDTVDLIVPEQRPLRVVLVGDAPDPFLRLALAALDRTGMISASQAPLAGWRPDPGIDAVILAGGLPEAWPEGRPVLVIDPPGSLPGLRVAPIRDGLPVEQPRATAHPVLAGVASGRVVLTQTAVIDPEGPLQALWTSPAGPVLAAGELRGARCVVLAARASASERLALLASWPLVVGNALAWICAPALERAAGTRQRTGAVVRPRGTALAWADGGTTALRGGAAELDRLGLWTSDGGDRGSAVLLDRDETALPAAPAAMAAAGGGWGGDLVPWLAGLLLVLAAVEAWAFHRQGVR
ncbi:MAG: hypothetical protein RLZZ127_1337 [Planctomycetota bacterium]